LRKSSAFLPEALPLTMEEKPWSESWGAAVRNAAGGGSRTKREEQERLPPSATPSAPGSEKACGGIDGVSCQ